MAQQVPTNSSKPKPFDASTEELMTNIEFYNAKLKWYDFLIIIVLASLSVYMIVEGSLCLTKCPTEPNIPIWLVVHGSSRALLILLYISMILCNKYSAKPKTDEFEPFIFVVLLFLAAWFITGNVLVYSKKDPIANAKCVCHDSAFWIIIAIWVIYVPLSLYATIFYMKFRKQRKRLRSNASKNQDQYYLDRF